MTEQIPADLESLAVPIDDLKPRKGNPRKGDTAAIRESLEKNGQYRPVVVNRRTAEVLAGNHTLKAARELGWTRLAATYVDATPEQAARIVLADNRTADLAEYDSQLLVDALRELGDLEGTGYTQADISSLLQELGAETVIEGKTDPDQVPDVPEKPTAKAGDTWALGDHRLTCGDSTDPATVERLMAGRLADLLLTDPPYGVDYVAKNQQISGGKSKHRDIENDELTGDALGEFLAAAFQALGDHVPPGAPAYIFHADTRRLEFESALRGAGFTPRQQLIWKKSRLVLGRQDYQWQHEPILYGWRDGAAHRWYGGYDKTTILEETAKPHELSKDELIELVRFIHEQLATTVLEADKPASSNLHPTTKPVELLERLIHNSSRYADAVLDTFGGSGSTLIAAERTGRHAYLAERDPGYCDVIVRRWQEHTGRQAVKLNG
jgi:DNA modification methylase